MCTFNNLPCFVSYLVFLNDDSNDVIAPPATPLQDFTYHWKQLMNFYVNHLTDCKVPIQSTGIPRHLDRLLEILLEEEKDENEPGPCLEYLLQHKLLDLLATLASAETPPGMRTICLSFLRKLLGRSKYPLLHHTSIYGPVQRLIALCNGNPPSPMEAEEVQFLLTLCFLVCKYPHVTNIINDAPTVQRHNASTRRNSERMEVEKVTYVPNRRKDNFNPLFEPLDTQAVTLINPNLFSSENGRRRSVETNRPPSKNGTRGSSSQSNDSISSREVENASQSSSPVIEKPICDENSGVTVQSSDSQDCDISQKSENVVLMNEIDTHLQNLQDLRLDVEYGAAFEESNCAEGDQNLLRPETPQKSKCLLLDALLSYINSADNTVRIRACEGIMVLASLEDPSFAQMVANSDLVTLIPNRLENLFNAIPAHVDPAEIDGVDVTWGLDSPMWTKEKKFSGCRQVAAFFMWFDYCNQLIREAHPDVANALAKNIKVNFLEKIVTPALAEHHVVLITALITKCLKELTSSALCTEISYWLVGHDRGPEIPNVWTSPVLHRLIDNCFTDSDDLTLETLKLFEEMIEKRNEHILHCLVLVYLSTRGYYDNTAADSAIASWSDEEDEREREKKKGSLDLSYEQSHSRTLAPSNIHRIVNCFLSLIPRYLQTDTDVNNYERYMADLERQYSTVLTDCSLMAWPLEAVTVDDSASSDSRPEADHCSIRFYMGPFMTMLFEKVANIPRQKYEVNLQLTVVISRLALLPHPYLHEFLLNPLLPVAPGTKNLFTCLQKVVKQLVNEVPKTPDHKQMLTETRERLLEDCSHEGEKENILFESVIVTEEFCKELAAIAYVKYHHSM
ncbi:protein FAM160B1 isoform X2 [Bombus impatiens]|uniref:Protein FAM160B1 isoform X2 n=1 Tax=Bombus impatiens TaxID=132113 RepID=A0A6P3UNZ2_BOMIM|nr:protein FAM160B1 isoform X2 [Bombus impatiens]